jgi:hypothetical protein
MVVGIPCMANTDTKINKVYMNVITTLAACCGELLGNPRLVPRSSGFPRPKKTSVGPVTSGVHLLDRQVRDAHSISMADDLELSDIPLA